MKQNQTGVTSNSKTSLVSPGPTFPKAILHSNPELSPPLLPEELFCLLKYSDQIYITLKKKKTFLFLRNQILK
uniref:Uncharacterized protein n=1 Tax=Gossypium raimondii TaxID=29730 RepID=A0A0D2QD89_GOSRA|nr:hypothetical protein B456_009G104300 [Gossypium raimondii]